MKKKTAACRCQHDAHFGDGRIPGTSRHPYGQRVPVETLVGVDVLIVGEPDRTGVLKCAPCRAAHHGWE